MKIKIVNYYEVPDGDKCHSPETGYCEQVFNDEGKFSCLLFTRDLSDNPHPYKSKKCIEAGKDDIQKDKEIPSHSHWDNSQVIKCNHKKDTRKCIICGLEWEEPCNFEEDFS